MAILNGWEINTNVVRLVSRYIQWAHICGICANLSSCGHDILVLQSAWGLRLDRWHVVTLLTGFFHLYYCSLVGWLYDPYRFFQKNTLKYV